MCSAQNYGFFISIHVASMPKPICAVFPSLLLFRWCPLCLNTSSFCSGKASEVRCWCFPHKFLQLSFGSQALVALKGEVLVNSYLSFVLYSNGCWQPTYLLTTTAIPLSAHCNSGSTAESETCDFCPVLDWLEAPNLLTHSLFLFHILPHASLFLTPHLTAIVSLFS